MTSISAPPAVVAGVLEDIEREDDREGYENAEDAAFWQIVSGITSPSGSGQWQCSQCSRWFPGPPSQTCPACS